MKVGMRDNGNSRSIFLSCLNHYSIFDAGSTDRQACDSQADRFYKAPVDSPLFARVCRKVLH